MAGAQQLQEIEPAFRGGRAEPSEPVVADLGAEAVRALVARAGDKRQSASVNAAMTTLVPSEAKASLVGLNTSPHTLLEASNDPDVLANEYLNEIDYPKHGKRLKVHASPWHFSETPARIGIAPELGGHNDEILAEIGYSPAQIRDLRERKII